MKCARCGSQPREGDIVCRYCGEKFEQVQRDPGFERMHGGEAAAPKKTHVASLVLSIVGFVFAILLPLIAYPCAIVGLVLSVKRRHSHKTTAAMVLCIIALIVALINSVLGAFLAVAELL